MTGLSVKLHEIGSRYMTCALFEVPVSCTTTTAMHEVQPLRKKAKKAYAQLNLITGEEEGEREGGIL